MTWLRIDDGFTSNSKIVQLTDAEFRTWIRTLCHCGKADDPTVDSITLREVPGLTKHRVERYLNLRLLDTANEAYEIHDWLKYRPKDSTNAERQARWRSRNNGTRTVTQTVTNTGTKSEPSHAGTCGSSPDQTSSKTLSALRQGDAGDSPNGSNSERDDDELTKLLDKLGATEGDRLAAAADPSRAMATARFSLAQPDVSRPLAYYRKIVATGLYPEGAEHVTPGTPRPLAERLANLIRNTGRHDTEAGVRSEIADEERRSGETLTDEQRRELLELWQSLQPDAPVEAEPP